MSIKTYVSVGEFVDKLTILQIKSERITDKEKLANVLKEKAVLEDEWNSSKYKDINISREWSQLLTINKDLWDIEDNIREKERLDDFGQSFIDLARAVYITNDKRAKIKKEINKLSGSVLTEEKSYSEYHKK